MGWMLLLGSLLAGEGGPDVIRERFDGPSDALPTGWQMVCGEEWKIEGGALVGQSLQGEGLILLGDPAWQNYEIEVTIVFLKLREERRWASVVVRAGSKGATPWSHVAFRQNAALSNGVEFAVRTAPKTWSVRARRSAGTKLELGKPYRVRVVVRGPQVEGYLDGRPVLESRFCVDRAAGCVGLAVSGAQVKFDDFVLRRLPDSPPEWAPVKSPVDYCEVLAHRGFSAVAPENTLAAIAKAIESGSDGCEFDVYASKDGHIVLMHDEAVDRTTDGRGKVAELTLAELKRLDAGRWKAPEYKGQQVPTLEEALQMLRRSKCRAVIELKPSDITKKVVETIRRSNMTRQVVLISFHASAIREARELAPEIPAAWLFGKSLEGPPEQQAQWIAQQAAECRTHLVDLNFEIVSPELIAQLHRRGLKVWVWTVNEPVVIQVLHNWGVDAITTDDPALARKVLGSNGPNRSQ